MWDVLEVATRRHRQVEVRNMIGLILFTTFFAILRALA